MSEEYSVLSNLIEDYAIYVVAASTIAGALITIYKKVVEPVIKHFTEWYDMIEKVDKIFDEITPNGGTSIKDKVDQTYQGLALLSQITDAMAADTKAALFRTDPEGNCVWVNRTYTRTVGRDVSELLGHGWQNAIAAKDRAHVVTEWYRAVEENRDFVVDYNFETPDGKLIPCRGRGYKLVNPRGELLGYHGNCEILKNKI